MRNHLSTLLLLITQASVTDCGSILSGSWEPTHMSTPCASYLEYNDGLFHLRTSVGRRPSQKDLENFCNQYIFLVPPGPAPGPCPRFLPSCPGPGAGSSAAPLGSNWRLRPVFGEGARRRPPPPLPRRQLEGQFCSLVHILCVWQELQWSWAECHNFYRR